VEKKRKDAMEKAKMIGLSDALTNVAQGTCNKVHVSTQSWGDITLAGLGF
jgi:hypothetical protein